MHEPIRIVIVDDHPIFRQGLRQALAADPRLELVGEASDGKEAVRMVCSLRPAVVILDLSLPGLDGLKVAQTLQRLEPGVNVIALTMHKEDGMVHAALDRGVRGYVLKECAAHDLVAAIKSVVAGEMFVTPCLAGALVRRAQRAAALSRLAPGLARLTPTERRVLRLVAENRTNRQIAQLLFISVRTVETHRAHLCEKLALHGSHTLLQFALEHRDEL